LKQIRKRLTYANVMSSIAVFLILGGATAIAAKKIGTKQIKANAITTGKIKKNAVTKAKIKNGAIDGSKIADGSVTGSDINGPSTPFSQVVHRARGATQLVLTGAFQQLALSPANYTQLTGEDDQFMGALDVTFPAGCTQPRSVQAALSIDSPNPAVLTTQDVVAFGFFTDTGAGTVNKRVELGPWPGLGSATRFGPELDKGHTLSVLALGSCNTGSGIVATRVGVDVLGTK
jgi:hypothetical protein